MGNTVAVGRSAGVLERQRGGRHSADGASCSTRTVLSVCSRGGQIMTEERTVFPRIVTVAVDIASVWKRTTGPERVATAKRGTVMVVLGEDGCVAYGNRTLRVLLPDGRVGWVDAYLTRWSDDGGAHAHVIGAE